MIKKKMFFLFSLILSCLVVISSMEKTGSATIIQKKEYDAVTLDPTERFPSSGGYPFMSCSVVRDNCGTITPSGASVFIADGAYNSLDGTIFFVDVPSSGDGVFQVDPATCSVVSGTYYSVNGGVSQRGIGYDALYHVIWVGGWNDQWLNQYHADPPYYVIENSYLGIPIASIAVDPVNRFLFVGTNESTDMLYVYDITYNDLGDLLGFWTIPWQSNHDGYDMAGMGFDEDSGQLVIVNQYGAGLTPSVIEFFDFDLINGPVGAGYCTTGMTGYAWGLGLVNDGNPAPNTSTAYCPDIASFSSPFDLDEYGTKIYQLCFKDQYDNEYQFDINLSEHYIYGVVVLAQPCDTQTYYLQGSYYFTNSGIEFQLSASNPLGDDDFCVPAYMLKGERVGSDWQFMWYYPDNPVGSQPGILVSCSTTVPDTATGSGVLK